MPNGALAKYNNVTKNDVKKEIVLRFSCVFCAKFVNRDSIYCCAILRHFFGKIFTIAPTVFALVRGGTMMNYKWQSQKSKVLHRNFTFAWIIIKHAQGACKGKIKAEICIWFCCQKIAFLHSIYAKNAIFNHCLAIFIGGILAQKSELYCHCDVLILQELVKCFVASILQTKTCFVIQKSRCVHAIEQEFKRVCPMIKSLYTKSGIFVMEVFCSFMSISKMFSCD